MVEKTQTHDKAHNSDSDPMDEDMDIVELSVAKMDALIERTESVLQDGLAPEPEDVRMILQILRQFMLMQTKLEGSKYLKERYLKLMGLMSSSENQQALFGDGNKTGRHAGKTKKAGQSGRNTAPVNASKPDVHHHKLQNLEKGQTCPDCEQGKLYKFEPASFIRITGQPPLSCEKHIMAQLRCNACGQLFTAPLPDEVTQDGVRGQQYGYSARAIMAIDKFFMGNPYYRQDSLQALLGMPVSASTIYDQCASLSRDLAPVFEAMKAQAANAWHFHIDDTGNRILGETAIEKPNRNGTGTRRRTGVYTSSCIASLRSQCDQDHQVVLFNTDIGHAGEWIDEILAQRHREQPKPLVMSDALSSNRPTVVVCEESLCNAHGRRGFVDVQSNFPKEVEYVVTTYAKIWEHDSHTQIEGMGNEARLAWHIEHSLPVMKALKLWCETQQHSGKVEDNSGLGKAISYFLKHYTGLTAFCRLPGAKLDNNWVERIIKLVARGRKNSLFYKTAEGARVGDIITSLIATCELNGVNVFEYLTAVQRHRWQASRAPEQWLPWNYREKIEQTEIGKAA